MTFYFHWSIEIYTDTLLSFGVKFYIFGGFRTRFICLQICGKVFELYGFVLFDTFLTTGDVVERSKGQKIKKFKGLNPWFENVKPIFDMFQNATSGVIWKIYKMNQGLS